MEAKLKEYRARRRRQEFVEKTTEKLENTKRRFVDLFRKMIKIKIDDSEDDAPVFKEEPAKEPIKTKSKSKSQLDTGYKKNNKVSLNEEKQSLVELDSDTTEEVVDEGPQQPWQHVIIKWTIYAVMWLTLFFYFITLQFGAVFFAISLLIFIYINTGTRPRKKGEASAYSVFNENCESIDGTVTAEKLQKEMFFGSFRLF